MGILASRDTQESWTPCSTVYSSDQQRKEILDNRLDRPTPSPREFVRSGSRERKPWERSWDKLDKFSELSDRDRNRQLSDSDKDDKSVLGGFVPAAAALAAAPVSSALEQIDEVAESEGYAQTEPQSKSGYAPLNLEEVKQEFLASNESEDMVKGKCSAKMMTWHDDWLHSVECGELDIYTCLGLSDTFSFGPDTRRIVGKVIGVCVLQVMVPCILLEVQLASGFSYEPKMPGWGFRTMGACLYLYSLYNMYNNALDECRSQLLQWSFEQKVPIGYWLPMLMGEITNVFVSLILVLTLFVIFVDVEHPADLILNAVAVNFLGAVDGEFVDDPMKRDALQNFKELFYLYGSDEDVAGKDESHSVLSKILDIMLFIIVISGLALSCIFFVTPSPEHQDKGRALSAAWHHDTANIGRGDYMHLI